MLALEMLQKHEPVIPERAVLQLMEAGLTGYPGLRVQ